MQSPSLQSRSSGQQGQGQGSVPPSSGRTKRQRSGPKSLPDAAQQQQQRQPFVAGLPSEGTSSGLMAVSGGSFGEPDAQLQQRPGRLEWQDEFGDGALPSPGDLLDATQDGSDGNGQLLPPLLPSLGGSSLGGGAMHLTGRGSELLLVDTSMLGEQLPSNFLDSPRQQAQAAQAAPMQAAAAPAAAPEAAPAEASPSLPAAAQLVEADAEPQAMEADPQPAEMQQREEQLPPEPTVQQGAAAEPGQKELQAVPVLEPRPEFVQQEGRAAGSEPSAGEPAASPDPGGQPAETAADSVDLAAEPAAVEAPTGGADDAAAAAEEVRPCAAL